MEEKMKDIILKDLSEYRGLATQLNKDVFADAVCSSFNGAKSAKHYVVLMPIDLDDKFNPDQHKSFAKNGFYQIPNEEMYSNIFLACDWVIGEMISLLQGNEDMTVDKCTDQSGKSLYVVSLFGLEQTFFEADFGGNAQQNTKQRIDD